MNRIERAFFTVAVVSVKPFTKMPDCALLMVLIWREGSRKR